MAVAETERGAQCLVEMNPQTQATKLLAPVDSDPANKKTQSRRVVDEKCFTFDNSFWSHDRSDADYAHQEDVYNTLGEEFLDHNFEGYHTCIFAYGQTGSGKSYTMMGMPDEPGIIPRTCEDLFQRIEGNKSPHVSYTVRVSYFEVYNEHVRDLLTPPSSSQARGSGPNYLKIREHPQEGPYIKDLTDLPVRNYGELMHAMRMGDASRTTASTKMNDTSSRSHAVFTIMLKQIHHDLSTDSTTERTARIRLVDLAGSERAKATEATGARLREGSNINKSLTTLGRVIAALADPKAQARGGPGKARSKDVVPYRDSILTWLLKDSLGGNSKTAMIACIAPSDYDETLSTLRYADQAKRIRTRAIVNQDSVSAAQRDAQIAEMQNTIRELQVQVSVANAAASETHVRALNKGEARDEKLEEYQSKVERMQRLMEEERLVGESKIRQLVEQNEALRRHLKLAVESLKNPIPTAGGVGSRKESLQRDRIVEGARRVSGLSMSRVRVRDSLGRMPKANEDEDEDEDETTGKFEDAQEDAADVPEMRLEKDTEMLDGGEPRETPVQSVVEDEEEPELDWDGDQSVDASEEEAIEMQARMEELLKDLTLFRRKVADDHDRFGVKKGGDTRPVRIAARVF